MSCHKPTAMLSRRGALAVLGGALAVASGARADQPLPLLHVGIIPIFAVAPYFAAEKFGYFAREGIATTTQPVQGGAIGIPGLASGSLDVLYSNSLSFVQALERGIDLRVIAQGTTINTNPPDVTALLKRKIDNFKTGKDLEGKSVAVTARFDISWLVVQAWVKKTGGDPSKIVYREVPLPSMLDALRTRQVDAALVIDPFLTIGRSDSSLELLAWPSSMVMGGMPSSLWITSGAAAEHKTDLIRAYIRAYRKGVAWNNAHIGDPEYLTLVADFTKSDPKLLAQMTLLKQPTEISVAAIDRFVALCNEYGILKTKVDVGSKIFSL